MASISRQGDNNHTPIVISSDDDSDDDMSSDSDDDINALFNAPTPLENTLMGIEGRIQTFRSRWDQFTAAPLTASRVTLTTQNTQSLTAIQEILNTHNQGDVLIVVQGANRTRTFDVSLRPPEIQHLNAILVPNPSAADTHWFQNRLQVWNELTNSIKLVSDHQYIYFIRWGGAI